MTSNLLFIDINEPFFPWRFYSLEDQEKEYIKLKKIIKQKITFPIPFSTVGYKCSNEFFQFERMKTDGRGTRTSAIDFWNKNKKRMIDFSIKENRDLFSTLNYFNHSPSQFSPVLACKIYRYFNATKVFDPYAGWGDRCLAAMALNINYTGVECNLNLEKPFSNLIKRYKPLSKINIIIDKCENINIKNIDFDFVLTSPPFWNKKEKLVERYFNTETNYKLFIQNSLIPVLKSCIEKNIATCVYIPENMYDDLTEKLGECNFKLHFKAGKVRNGLIYCWNLKLLTY